MLPVVLVGFASSYSYFAAGRPVFHFLFGVVAVIVHLDVLVGGRGRHCLFLLRFR